jgi:HAMP domain-containing protein
MIELTETTMAMMLAFLGVVGTLIWYALAWYGISTLRDIRNAVDQTGLNSE